MKKLFVAILFMVCVGSLSAQTFSFTPHDTALIFTPLSDMSFKAPIVNTSSMPITVYVVRTENNIPGNWFSSLCFGQNCFAFFIDSVASTADFGEQPIQPGDTLDFSLHVFTDTIKGDAFVTLKVGIMNSPTNFIIQQFRVTQTPTSIDEKKLMVENFQLLQNYPNPFNPSTKIKFSIPSLTPSLSQRERVMLKVFDILGREVATLVDEELSPGVYEVEFNINDEQSTMNYELNSNIYFYRLTTGNFSATRKFILIK